MIPEFQEIFYPLLKTFEDNEIHKTNEIYEKVTTKLNISKETINRNKGNSKQTIYRSRIGWAQTYLYKAGLIKQIKKAHYQITEEGQKVLNDSTIQNIDYDFLKKYQSFLEFQNPKKET